MTTVIIVLLIAAGLVFLAIEFLLIPGFFCPGYCRNHHDRLRCLQVKQRILVLAGQLLPS